VPRSFFRLVDTNSSTRDDFLSAIEKGQPPLDRSLEAHRIAEGLSVNATLKQARKRARTVPSLRHYRFVAELSIPDDAPVEFRRTFSSPGHHTLWGDPDILVGYVVSVHPVDAVD
jgi:hypothetical protein